MLILDWGEHQELWGSHRRALGCNSSVICRVSAPAVLTPFVA
jgi:hypothetical protein